MLEDVAKERSRESLLLEQNDHMCGAVYLAGYVVECRLKSLLNKMGKPFPASGRSGHNLVGLWDAAGLRSKDIRGHRRAFLDLWDTSLRYRANLPPSPCAAKELLIGARDLAAIVTRQIRTTRVRWRGSVRS